MSAAYEHPGTRLLAVLVGCDKYGGQGELATAASDVERLSGLLRRSWGDRCRLVDAPGKAADDLLSAVRDADSALGEHDALLVYCKCFCREDGGDGEVCLALPGNGEIDFLPVSRILAAAETAAARRRLLILDCPPLRGTSISSAALLALRDQARHWTVVLTYSPGETPLDIVSRDTQSGARTGLFVDAFTEATLQQAKRNICGADLPQTLVRTTALMADRIADNSVAPAASSGCADAPAHQTPIIVSGIVAAGGAFGYLLAEQSEAVEAAKLGTANPMPMPASDFVSVWRSLSFGRWPLEIPYLDAIRLIVGLNYGLVMLTTIAAFDGLGSLAAVVSAALAGLLGFLTWPALLGCVAAVDQARRRCGIAAMMLAMFAWNAAVLLACSLSIRIASGSPVTALQVIDSLILALMLSLYSNMVATLIALADYSDRERGKVRFLIQLYRQLRRSIAVIERNRLLQSVSATPACYFWLWVISLAFAMAELQVPSDAVRWGLLFRNGWLALMELFCAAWYLYSFYVFRNTIQPRR